MKGVQLFTKEYLEQCRAMTPHDIAIFVDQFRQIHGARLQHTDIKDAVRKTSQDNQSLKARN